MSHIAPRIDRSSSPVKVRLDVEGRASAVQRGKLETAAGLLERALNDPGFEAALKQRFGDETGGRIYQRILSGAEVLSPKADGEADLKVGFSESRWSRSTNARSSSGRSLIQLNRSTFEDRDARKVAGTLGHMLGYKLGFGEAVADVMGDLARKFRTEQPATTPGRKPGRVPGREPGPVDVPDPATPGNSSRKPSEFITAFSQGKEGNCVSIAAIKAAMVRFGEDGVFSKLQRVSGGYDVVMRDGFKCRVTDAEVRTASGLSRMKGGNKALLGKANLLYAAMAKRAQLEGNDRRSNMSYSRACESLNDGENYREGAKWLGLEKYVKKISPSDVQRYNAVVAASSKHAVFSTGNLVDHYGNARQNSRGGTTIEGWGRRISGAYALV